MVANGVLSDRRIGLALVVVSVFGASTGLGIVFGLASLTAPPPVRPLPLALTTASPAAVAAKQNDRPAPRLSSATAARRAVTTAAAETDEHRGDRSRRRRAWKVSASRVVEREHFTPETPGEAEARLHAIHDALADRLEREATDPAWAGAAQARIAARVAENTPAGATLLGTHCRTSVCRLEIGFGDLRARDESLMAVPLLVPWDSEAFVYADTEDASRVIVYASREGSTLLSGN